MKINRKIAYPDYNSQYKYHDLGLIELENAPKIDNTNVTKALLPTKNKISSKRYFIAGLGSKDEYNTQPEMLQKVKLKIYSHDDCDHVYKKGSIGLPKGVNESLLFCAGETEKDTCRGDSGSALVLKSGRNYTIYGIVISGQGCGISAGLYLDVFNYVKWINENTLK